MTHMNAHMNGMTSRVARVVIIAITVGCTVAPRAAGAQSTPRYHTLPADADLRPGPFDMAAPDMHAAHRLVGCYAVTVGPWSHSRAAGDTAPMPQRLDLLADWHTRIYIGFRLVARTPGFAAQLEKYPAAWGPIGADSLQVRPWANGSSSVALFMRRQPDGELRGTARYFHDARIVDGNGRWMWESYPTANVSLRPMRCEAGD
jgi:hypothetical protein